MKQTLVVNLFAGPGAGKSTGATYVFSKLKMLGIDAEYVSEFAKDKVWEENGKVFKCQFYITGKQAYKIFRCNGKVDVLITDSPIALGAFYADNEILKQLCIYESKKYNNLNFFIERKKKYNPNGRNQTEEEAKKIDKEIQELLEKEKEPFFSVEGNEEGYNKIVDKILEAIKYDRS